jgi:hypothetical protein
MSVIIPTFNRLAMLQELLSSLEEQEWRPLPQVAATLPMRGDRGDVRLSSALANPSAAVRDRLDAESSNSDEPRGQHNDTQGETKPQRFIEVGRGACGKSSSDLKVTTFQWIPPILQH